MPVYGLEKSGANNCASENISNIKAQKTSLRPKSIVLFYSIVFLHFQQEFSRFLPTKNSLYRSRAGSENEIWAGSGLVVSNIEGANSSIELISIEIYVPQFIGHIKVLLKGQIDSECLFDVFKFSKNSTKNLTNFCPRI